jgi:hypothetical protein
MPPVEDIYKNKDAVEDDLETMLEKLAILTHIYDREFQLQVNHGHGATLLRRLWAGKFADDINDTNLVAQVFERVNQPYRQKLKKTFDWSLEKLKDTEAEGRLYIESMEAAEKRFDRKLLRNYRFVANPMREQLTVLMNAKLLFAQVEKNIRTREEAGEDMEETKILLRSLVPNGKAE